MPNKVSREEYDVCATEFNRRSALAEEKGEEIRKTLEPRLIAEGFTGYHAYIDVNTCRYVVGKDYDEAAQKAKNELGPNRLCWGFDVGVAPQLHVSSTM